MRCVPGWLDMAVTRTHNGLISSEAINALRAAAWKHVGAQDWGLVLARGLGWVCAVDDDHIIGFVNVAWDGGVHAFLLDTTVYACDDPAYAAGHAFSWRSAAGIVLGSADDQLIVRVPGAERRRLDQPIFICSVPAASFELLPDVTPVGRTYRSLVPVRPLGVEAVATVRAAMARYGGPVVVDAGAENRGGERSAAR